MTAQKQVVADGLDIGGPVSEGRKGGREDLSLIPCKRLRLHFYCIENGYIYTPIETLIQMDRQPTCMDNIGTHTITGRASTG